MQSLLAEQELVGGATAYIQQNKEVNLEAGKLFGRTHRENNSHWNEQSQIFASQVIL